ncbi:MAG: CPBP family intramembrane metalloprotease [Deltaproteobacteria bacterium]|nr:CPBP family intramembrane metalloprotease [Deltaproteobacteria bacterium]
MRAAAGFILYYLLCLGAIVFVLQNRILPWPFHGTGTLSRVWLNVGVYLPVLLMAAISLAWLGSEGMRVRDAFAWRKIHWLFYIGLVVSVADSVYLFTFNRFPLHAYTFWPPVLLLSAMNAAAEETFYRLVIYRLTKRLIKHSWMANLVQSVIYAIPHLWIGGPQMVVFAFIYGLILGMIVEKNDSVVPAMICHFCIDIGNIGLPLLIMLP